MKIKEYPEFSWSFSRHKTLLDCELKYYHSYYSSHNGWLMTMKDQVKKHTYRLKRLSNLEMVLGEQVHEYIEKMIDSKNEDNMFNEKDMYTHIWSNIERIINHSFSQYLQWYEKPKSVLMLHEVYYENNIPTDTLSTLKKRLEKIVNHLFQNETFLDVINNRVAVERDSEKFRYMINKGIKIWLKMDLYYTNPVTQKHTVVDWKTGKSSRDDRYQLSLYSNYISKSSSISDLDKIEIKNEYLLANESKSYSIKQVDINNMRSLVDISINQMKSYLKDCEGNIPLDITFFKKTTVESTCSKCNFKEICGVV